MKFGLKKQKGVRGKNLKLREIRRLWHVGAKEVSQIERKKVLKEK